jgi:hypothetical protein
VEAFDSIVSTIAEYNFRIEYSIDNGSTWTVRGGAGDSVSIPVGAGPGSDQDGINTSGSESIDLPNPGAIDITQIRVRDRIFARASATGSTEGIATSGLSASISNIRLEVETAAQVCSSASHRSNKHDDISTFLPTNKVANEPTKIARASGLGEDNSLVRRTGNIYFEPIGLGLRGFASDTEHNTPDILNIFWNYNTPQDPFWVARMRKQSTFSSPVLAFFL